MDGQRVRMGRLMVAVAIAGAVLVGLVGCGSDGSSDESSSETGSDVTVAEDLRATPEAVAQGLGAIGDLSTEAADAVGVDDEAAAAASDGIEGEWAPIEGTVLENEEDTYLAYEDAFALLGGAVDDGDADTAAEAQTTIADTTEAYLAEFPG